MRSTSRARASRASAAISSGNFRDDLVLAQLIFPVDCFLGQQVDHAFEGAFAANRELHGDGFGAQPLADGLDGPFERCADPVHLVDEANPRDPVAVGLPPDGFTLRFHTLDGVKNDHAAVEHAERALDFGRKIDMAGRIDDIDLVAFPLCRNSSGNDRNTPFAFLNHPVRYRGAVVHRADAVRLTGIEQDPLGGRGFTGVNMGNDPNIAVAL